jgi:hypothetical protein
VLCFNYLVGEEALALKDRDPFTAHQLVSLKPVAGSDTYLKLMQENGWVAEHYPNFYRHHRDYQSFEGEPSAQRVGGGVPTLHGSVSAGAPWIESLLGLGGGYLLERVARGVLRTYLKWRAKGAGNPPAVKLADERVKLHFKDHGAPLNARLHAIMGEIDGELQATAEL